MCVFLCASRPIPCPSWLGVRCGGVCLGPGCSRAPPLLAGVLGRVCVCVCARLVPRHSWLGCAVWACVLGLRFRLCPASLGSGVGVCLCSCVYPACTLPFLAAWCVCVWVWVFSALWFFPRSGAGARHLLCAPHPFPVTFTGAACGVGLCGCCSGWGLPPPSPLDFLRVAGGVWYSAPSCRRFVVFLAGCPDLGSRGLSPPFPSCLECAFVFLFARLRPSEVCVGVFRVYSLLLGHCSRLGVASFGWVVLRCSLRGSRLRCCLAEGFARLLWCGWAVLWLSAFLVPSLLVIFGGVSACSSFCLPSCGASTGRHSVWLTGLLLVLAYCWDLPRPHGSAGLCTRLARWPFLSG